MPEVVEVTRSTNYLISRFSNAIVTGVKIHESSKLDTNLITKIPVGNKFYKITSKGKVFMIFITEEVGFKCHFMLGGMWTESEQKNSMVTFYLQNEGKKEILSFVKERLSTVSFFETKSKSEKILNSLAPSFLGEYVHTLETWRHHWKNGYSGSKMINSALMEQEKLCSGLGNYLVSEILYEAKIYPKAKLKDISDEKRDELFEICLRICQKFYYNPSARKEVYKRKTTSKGEDVVALSLAGRTRWYSPEAQIVGL